MTSHGAADVLVVFARSPDAGRVKTRLARSIGDRTAAALYAAFVADLRDRFAAAPFAVRWAVAPPEGGFAERFGLDPRTVFVQQGDDLGARMRDAFARMLGAGFARCAIVGSDMPQLRVDTVRNAFAHLAQADLVLGPADDGGYYLIAARGVPDVFDGVAWGTGSVLAATLARAQAGGLATALLERGFDVDVEPDLERLRA
ncbi:MAG: TIGR04282 family arsenosugar biosynthesis glycosyltransferase, partial [Thermodesulfobacteriota bacterium]